MDILAQFLARIRRLGHQIYRALATFLPALFGHIAWTPPPWMSATRGAFNRDPSEFAAGTPAGAAAVRRSPRLIVGGIFVGLLTAATLFAGIDSYLDRPQPPEPDRMTFEVHVPDITGYEDADGNPALLIHPLEVTFSGSAAPIERVGKTVTHGITMDPAMKGTWTWTDDHTLQFLPETDWAVGGHVEVKFDAAQVFAPQVLMAEDTLSFDMPKFAVTAGEGEFYQDPENPIAKKTIMPVTFNYPVDPADFEKHIALKLVGRGANAPQDLKFTVTYDAGKMKAWIHSQPLNLPRDDDAVAMTLEGGAHSTRGGEATADKLEMSVRVPGLYSLTVGDASPTLVDNDKYEPEQVVVVETSDAVRGTDLLGAVRAWVLPKRKAGVKQEAGEPPYDWSPSEVGDDVLRHATPIKLELVPTEREYAGIQSFKYHAEPGQVVYLRFSNGLKSFGGYFLAKAKTQTFTVPDFPKLLRFMANGSLLSLSGDKRVSVVSRNIPGMKLEIGRVLPEQLQHLVSFNSGSYTQPDISGTFDEDHIVERFQQLRPIPKARPGEAHYEGFDLSDYLKAGKHGIFLLRLTDYDPKKAKADTASDDSGDENEDAGDGGGSGDLSDTRMVVVTDLGLLAKRNLDGSRDVFVQSIRTGKPVGGAAVAVIALNGQTLFSETSSADGAVHFPTLKGLAHELKPVMFVVKLGDDLSFLPIDAYDRKLDYSRFDVGGEANPTTKGELSAYLFSDRGIYRPGDLFHIGMIVRTASWAQSPAGIPLQAEIVDPRGLTVRKQAVSVDASGFTEISFTPADTAPTGTWTVNLFIVGKDNNETAIGSTTVSVKEFLPDSMKVDAGLSAHIADGWVTPNGLKGLVDVHNLFGTPASNRRIEASLTLNPTFPAFRAWAGYNFYDLRHAKDGYTTQLQDGHTDEAGHAEFDLDLKKYADATYRLDFLAKAYEAEGGRNVAASSETLVSSNPWLVGYKAADPLAYIKRNSPRSIHLIAIDPQTKSIAVGGLTAQLIERRYVSVLTKQDSGVYKYESKLKEVFIGAKPLAIPAGGVDYALPTDKPGDYALQIRQGNAEVNEIAFSVSGDANVSRALDRNAELEIKLSKADYAPGEAVEISLRAPYAGSGLITIERDRVYAHAWFTATTTNSVQHITVPKGFEGNGYINVQYIRDPSSNEIFMSPLSYGVAPFSVNVDARRNALTLDAPDVVKPGQTVTFHLHAGRPTKAVVFAVDEGILQVAHYKLGDPLTFFFRKRMLQVQTAQILDLILPDFKRLMALAAPGGDGGDAVGRQLNPFKRKHDKPVVYWSGIVEVNGDKDLQYTVPDYFHGKLHVMAVAVAPDLVGTAENATTVRGDFVLSPDAPTTLAPGDEAEIGVGVSNNVTGAGDKPMAVTVTLKSAAQMQVMGPATQTVLLAPMHEGSLRFRVKASEALGSGTLTFTAASGGHSAVQRVDVSVRPAAAFRTQVDIGRVALADVATFPGLRNMYAPYSRRSASISTIPLVLTEGLTSFLVNYDNYCSEQIVSASMPRMLAAKWSALPVFTQALTPVAHPGAAADALAAQIEALRSRQNSQGGFGVWAATPDADPFVSAYAVHFLLEARDHGARVPKDMLDSGNTYLRTLADDDSLESLSELRQRAYAIYLLTRQGNVTTNEIAGVQKRLNELFPKDWKDDLAAAWLAASYKLLKQDKQANELIAPLQARLDRITADETYYYGYYNDPLTRDASVLYLLAKTFPDRARQLSARALENIARPLQKNQFNTLSAAMTMLALDAYAGNSAVAIDRLGIEEVAANGTAKPIATAQNQLLQSGTWSAGALRLRFRDGDAQPAWFVVDQAGYDRGVPTTPIRNGLEIIREYTDVAGKPLGPITLGQEIDVHVKIRAIGKGGIGDIAIVDLLPGGFEPVMQQPPAPANGEDDGGAASPTIRVAGSSWAPTYTDVREDRVVIYGSATPGVGEFIYRIKADSAGTFVVPPAYGESMYDRRIQARAAGGAHLIVVRKP